MPQPFIQFQTLALAAQALRGSGRAWRVLGCALLVSLLGACAHGPESDVATQALAAPDFSG